MVKQKNIYFPKNLQSRMGRKSPPFLNLLANKIFGGEGGVIWLVGLGWV